MPTLPRPSERSPHHALGQSVRARGLTKDQGMELYQIEAGEPYARIAYDAGYRGLSL